MTPEESLSRVALVKSETKRLSEYWRGFAEAQWKTPTFCPGWNADDAVSHLATGGTFYANSARRGLEGLPPEPPYGKDAKEFLKIRKQKGEELKALPREKMMDAFDETAAELQAIYDGLKADDLGKKVYHPRGLHRMDAWVGLRLTELVVHDWDIRYGQDPGARAVPGGVEGMLTFLPATAARLFNVRDKVPFDGRFHFRSTEPAREWTLAVSGEKAEESPDVSGGSDAVITSDAEAYLLLLFGRIKREKVVAKGRLKVEGDAKLAEELLSVIFTVY